MVRSDGLTNTCNHEKLYNHSLKKVYNHGVKNPNNHGHENPNTHEGDFSYTHGVDFHSSRVVDFRFSDAGWHDAPYPAGHTSGLNRYPVSNEKNMNAKGYYKKLITSPRWVKLRTEKVANNPLCENCLLSDITTPTQEVHHIRPVESAPDQHTMLLLCFDYNNLQSLCSKCHKTVHIELKSYTKEETQKRNKAKTDNFVAKFLKRHNPP